MSSDKPDQRNMVVRRLIEPNATLPSGQPGYALLGVPIEGVDSPSIEVLVGLSPGCHQLDLTDPQVPEL